MATALTNEPELKTGTRRKSGALAGALIIQGALILLTVFIVVVVPSGDRDPEFVAKPTVYLPQRQLEHQAAVAEFQQAASPPVMTERLTTEAMLPDSLPDMPALPSDTFTPFDSEAPVANAEGLLGASGLMGALQGLTAGSSQVSFLGVEDTSTRLVIAFDISTSVVNDMRDAGMEITQVRDATAELIEGLNANTLFGLIQFARNHDVFRDYLVPATVENKAAALSWLNSEFRTDGMAGRGWRRGDPYNGIQAVMGAAFRYEPDVIFVVSNGRFYRTPSGGGSQAVPYRDIADDLDRLQGRLAEKARLHFIGFGVRPDIRTEVRRLTRRNQGHYREY